MWLRWVVVTLGVLVHLVAPWFWRAGEALGKGIGECVAFALGNRAYLEHLRTAWIHRLAKCSHSSSIVQVRVPRPQGSR